MKNMKISDYLNNGSRFNGGEAPIQHYRFAFNGSESPLKVKFYVQHIQKFH